MTSHTAHPADHHASTTKVALALAGAVLAVAAGWGIATVALDDPAPTAPTAPQPPLVGNKDFGTDPNGFRGTNREERALMHRR